MPILFVSYLYLCCCCVFKHFIFTRTSILVDISITMKTIRLMLSQMQAKNWVVNLMTCFVLHRVNVPALACVMSDNDSTEVSLGYTCNLTFGISLLTRKLPWQNLSCVWITNYLCKWKQLFCEKEHDLCFMFLIKNQRHSPIVSNTRCLTLQIYWLKALLISRDLKIGILDTNAGYIKTGEY